MAGFKGRFPSDSSAYYLGQADNVRLVSGTLIYRVLSVVAGAIYLQALFIVVGQVALPISAGSPIGVNTRIRIRRWVGV